MLRPLLFSLLALALARPALATGEYLTGYFGMFDILANGRDDREPQIGVEYHFRPWNYGIVPVVGVHVMTDWALYGYGGVNWEIPLVRNEWYLIPNFMVGAYHEGNGKDLGGALEFRSGIELAYQMPNRHRVGIAFNHISNASIYDKNPGAETLLINYSVPTDFFGQR